MTFASPMLAWMALAGVAMPILIHLLMRRRRQPIAWAAMDLLRRAVRRSARRSRLEQVLLLASRCLLVLAAGLAIAGPQWDDEDHQGGGRSTDFIIIIDQGVASMALTGEAGGQSMLDRSKGWALKSIEGWRGGDRAAVIVMAGPDENLAVVWPPSADVSSVRGVIESLGPSDAGSRPRAAMRLAVDRLLESQANGVLENRVPVLLVASGWTGGSLEAEGDADAADAVRALKTVEALRGRSVVLEPWTPPTPREESDRWVMPVLAERQGPQAGGVALRVEAKRRGAALGTESVTATIRTPNRSSAQGVQMSFSSTSPETGENIRLGSVPPGVNALGVRASIPADQQPADDDSFAVVALESTMTALVVDRQRFAAGGIEETPASTWVNRALDPQEDRTIDVVRVDPSSLESGPIPHADAIFILQPDLLGAGAWARIADAMNAGSTVVVTPPASERLDTWASTADQSMRVGVLEPLSAIESFEPVRALDVVQPESTVLSMIASELGDLAAPVEVRRLMRIPTPEGAEVLLRMSGGEPLLVRVQPEGCRGQLLVLGVPISTSWSNLPTKPLIVPLLQEIVRQAVVSRASAWNMVIGTHPIPSVPWSSASRVRSVMGRDDSTAVGEWRAVDGDGDVVGGLAVAGLYEVVDSGGETLGHVAVNVEPRRASNEAVDNARLLSLLTAEPAMEAVVQMMSASAEPVGVGGAADRQTSTPSQANLAAPWAWALLALSMALWALEGGLARAASHAGDLLPERWRR